MDVCESKAELRKLHASYRRKGGSIGLVTTMGYLHEGHMTLVRAAREANDHVIATIFVNPTQFGSAEDLTNYPRDVERDLAMLRAEGVDAVLVPSVEEMYPENAQTIVETTKLSRVLMGKIRPGHFRGVTTVVTKLFNICQPDRAYFGEKDYQQLLVIRTMARELDMPVEVIGVPTVREPDGLAMSSRNVRLSPEDRAASVVLSRSLFDAETRLANEPMTVAQLRRQITTQIEAEPRASIEGVDIRDAETLASVRGVISAPVVVLLAARFGPVMLIDQRVIAPALQM